MEHMNTSLIPKAYVWCCAPPLSLRLYFFIIFCKKHNWKCCYQNSNWQEKVESVQS